MCKKVTRCAVTPTLSYRDLHAAGGLALLDGNQTNDLWGRSDCRSPGRCTGVMCQGEGQRNGEGEGDDDSGSHKQGEKEAATPLDLRDAVRANV